MLELGDITFAVRYFLQWGPLKRWFPTTPSSRGSMCNLTWSRLAAFHCSRSVLQKEISVSSSHIHQHISHVHYVAYRWLSLMDIMCTCTCTVHCVCVNIWCFIYLLPHFFIFKHFSPTWYSDTWYNKIPALIYLHMCNTELIVYPFCILNFVVHYYWGRSKAFSSSLFKKNRAWLVLISPEVHGEIVN